MTQALNNKGLTAPLSGSGGGAEESSVEPSLRSGLRQSSVTEEPRLPARTGEPLWSDALPVGLRLAQRSDAERLFDICVTAFHENGFGHHYDEARVREVIAMGCEHRNGVAFGLIDGPTYIEAVLGLQLTKLWYGDDQSWYWSDLLLYVRPECRGSRHARKLFLFAHWWRRKMGLPVMLGMLPMARLEAKEALFSRYAKRAGSLWLVGDGNFRFQPPEGFAS